MESRSRDNVLAYSHERVNLECGCVNVIDGSIEYCPKHAAAPEMADALRGLLDETLSMNADLRKIGRGRPEDGAHPDCPIDVARALLARIEGE